MNISKKIKNSMKEHGFVFSKEELTRNVIGNFPLIISGASFMMLNMLPDINGVFYVLTSFLFIVIIFSQVSEIKKKIEKISLPVKIYSIISSFGICYFSRKIFCLFGTFNYLQKVLLHRTGIFCTSPFIVISYLLAIISFLSIFVFTSLLLNYTVGRLTSVFKGISRSEIIICSLMIIILSAFATYSFSISRAFWGTDLVYDIIYTSDTPVMINSNVYLNLYHASNDIKQPFFAVFSAPIVGFWYTLSIPFSKFNDIFTPLFMNYIQIIMLVAANYMTAKMLKTDKTGRICFMMISSLSYCGFLSAVMMEQYIVTYFWLIFAIYSYVENNNMTYLDATAAAGTIVTSAVLMPMINDSEEKWSIKNSIAKVEKGISIYLLVFFALGRIDIIHNLNRSMEHFVEFSVGETFSVRLNQYTSFLLSCFAAPDIKAVLIDAFGSVFYSLQLDINNKYNFSFAGALLFVLCIISLLLNRKNKLTLISGVWTGMSLLCLLIIGWGSTENGMILYSLYFAWALFVLTFQLIEWVSDKLQIRLLVPVTCVMLTVAMIIYNYHGFKDMLAFARKYYPM